MAYIKVDNTKVNKEVAEKLIKICPFNAFEYNDELLIINANCRICKMCVRKGPEGVCTLIEEERKKIDKTQYKGILVYVEQLNGKAHPVSFELIGKAKELAQISNDPVFALVIGSNVEHLANEALTYGVDKVYLYDSPLYEYFNVERYTNVIEVCFDKHKFSTILLGSTPQGRSFGPRMAARLRTGLTADCTKLEMDKNGDLLQIRPAFGGNIMAKIRTTNHRPQMATVRYKIFKKPETVKPFGQLVKEEVKDINDHTFIEILEILNKPKSKDISESEILICVGRAFKKQADLQLIEPLRKRLNADIACTRPLIENGWFDARHQVGLSGRTVKPKLIINIGISGAVHFIEGMKDAEMIITINNDPNNKLFNISHYSILGDLYEVLPRLNDLLEGENHV
ncbi:MAG: electron transfer flavoprotein subunit alpha/FixB family protein [Acholeplasmataceae bacterium]|nr:electron transfer flavoprotein subunit alpha/FixB family protein [Acholeplasmataceae bacterium]